MAIEPTVRRSLDASKPFDDGCRPGLPRRLPIQDGLTTTADASQAVLAAVGQHSQMPGPFDGRREPPLVLGANTALAPRLNLGLVRNVPL
jgi:hypothetical protein